MPAGHADAVRKANLFVPTRVVGKNTMLFEHHFQVLPRLEVNGINIKLVVFCRGTKPDMPLPINLSFQLKTLIGSTIKSNGMLRKVGYCDIGMADAYLNDSVIPNKFLIDELLFVNSESSGILLSNKGAHPSSRMVNLLRETDHRFLVFQVRLSLGKD